ncbi:hypothetical protein [Streptomyces sp. NPDC052693]|uniref:hypothetical protein n=1 Tax=Streptomyces sp. NPDC052693 TaxID=3155814 RepID=UPI003435A7FC
MLNAAETDVLTVDERPFAGEVRLTAGPGTGRPGTGGVRRSRLVVLVREGA